MVDAPADTRNAERTRKRGSAELLRGAGFRPRTSTLQRESGEAIALTRGEFALLREFVRAARPGVEPRFSTRRRGREAQCPLRPQRRRDGRAASEKGRSRSKTAERHPDRPGRGLPLQRAALPAQTGPRNCRGAARDSLGTMALPSPAAIPRTSRALSPVLAAAVALCLIAVGCRNSCGALLLRRPQETGPRFSMVVLPFANLTGDAGWDYLGKDMGVELTTLMGAFPNMHVVAGAAPGEADQDVRRAARAAGVRYVIAGAVDKVNDRLRYTAQLFDGASGHELWSGRYDDEGVDPKAPGPTSARASTARSRVSGTPLRRGGAPVVEQGRRRSRRL